MISYLFKKYKILGQNLLDAVDEIKQKNFAFTIAKKNTLIFVITLSLIITLLKPNEPKNFEGIIICKNKFNMTTFREFKNGKVFTKVKISSGKPFEKNKDFSNLNTTYKDRVIEWTAYVDVKGVKYPIKEYIDLKTMTYYTDLNVLEISNPKKRKLDQICKKN